MAMLLPVIGCAARPTPILPIAEARHLKPGALVTVGGAATTPAGLFQSVTRDEGFALQDRSAGIYVSVPIATGVDVGETVGVTGTLRDTRGQLTLVPASVANVVAFGGAMAIAPQEVATNAVNESTEGKLVRVHGKVAAPLSDDLPYGYKLTLDDGSGAVQVFIHASAGIDVEPLRRAQQLVVTGIAAQYDHTYEVLPRFRDDVRVEAAAKRWRPKARRRK